MDGINPAIFRVPRRELSFTSRCRVFAQGCVDFDASVAWPAFEHVRVVMVVEAVEQRRDGGGSRKTAPTCL